MFICLVIRLWTELLNFLWCWLGRTQSAAFDEKASMKKLRVASQPKTVFVLHTRPLALQKLSYDE